MQDSSLPKSPQFSISLPEIISKSSGRTQIAKTFFALAPEFIIVALISITSPLVTSVRLEIWILNSGSGIIPGASPEEGESEIISSSGSSSGLGKGWVSFVVSFEVSLVSFKISSKGNSSTIVSFNSSSISSTGAVTFSSSIISSGSVDIS